MMLVTLQVTFNLLLLDTFFCRRKTSEKTNIVFNKITIIMKMINMLL